MIAFDSAAHGTVAALACEFITCEATGPNCRHAHIVNFDGALATSKALTDGFVLVETHCTGMTTLSVNENIPTSTPHEVICQTHQARKPGL